MNLNFLTGTAAELIKVYPLIHLSLQRGHGTRVVMTGQSRENFLMQYRDFKLPESILVSLLESDGDLKMASSAMRWFARALCVGRQTFRAKLLLSGAGDFTVVHGDTLSTLAGAWLSRRAGIPAIHVEAGLRSPSLFNPFPEEINRRLVSRLATFHMAPDERALNNLRRARVKGTVVNTEGNTLLDAVLLSAANSAGATEPFVLTNLHRFENLNSPERWRKIIDTVTRAAEQMPVIFIAHPQTRHKLNQDPEALNRLTKAGVEIRDRMAFSAFIALLKDARYLISDGGSNQEECSYLGKPCLLMRESTERQEGLDGCCVLSRFEQKRIDDFLNNPDRYARAPVPALGSPSQRILDALAQGR